MKRMLYTWRGELVEVYRWKRRAPLGGDGPKLPRLPASRKPWSTIDFGNALFAASSPACCESGSVRPLTPNVLLVAILDHEVADYTYRAFSREAAGTYTSADVFERAELCATAGSHTMTSEAGETMNSPPVWDPRGSHPPQAIIEIINNPFVHHNHTHLQFAGWRPLPRGPDIVAVLCILAIHQK